MPAPVPNSPAPDAPVFDLDGGLVCLDFANTLGGRSGEHLSAYADLVAFATQADLITPSEADWLHAEAVRDASAADRVLARALRLRAALRAIFFCLARGDVVPQADLDVLNADLADSLAHACVIAERAAGEAFRWGWRGTALESPLWPIARSAAELLVNEQDRRLVRECGADDCQWLFVDTTKNRSRQWCSMQSCGNREKARRHYQRQRARQTAAQTGQPAGLRHARSGSSPPPPQAAADRLTQGQPGERG